MMHDHDAYSGSHIRGSNPWSPRTAAAEITFRLFADADPLLLLNYISLLLWIVYYRCIKSSAFCHAFPFITRPIARKARKTLKWTENCKWTAQLKFAITSCSWIHISPFFGCCVIRCYSNSLLVVVTFPMCTLYLWRTPGTHILVDYSVFDT